MVGYGVGSGFRETGAGAPPMVTSDSNPVGSTRLGGPSGTASGLGVGIVSGTAGVLYSGVLNPGAFKLGGVAEGAG